MQGAPQVSFDEFCRHEKERAREALRQNLREQQKVEALWARFSSRLEGLSVTPASAYDLSITESAARQAFIVAARGSNERAAARLNALRLRRAHAAAHQYERAMWKLGLPFLSRCELDRRAADWQKASDGLDAKYGDNEVMRAAYEIYGRKER